MTCFLVMDGVCSDTVANDFSVVWWSPYTNGHAELPALYWHKVLLFDVFIETSVHNFIAFVACDFFMTVMFDKCMFMWNKNSFQCFFGQFYFLNEIWSYLTALNYYIFTNTYLSLFPQCVPQFVYNWRFWFTANPNTFGDQ